MSTDSTNKKPVISLEQRVQIIEDKDAIRELKATYAYMLDERNMDGFLALFAEDAIIENPMGKYQGKTVHRENLQRAFDVMPFWVHMYVSPVIDILGEDRARGTWYMIEPETILVNSEEQAVWVCSRYDEEYQKIDGSWKFKHVRVTLFFQTSHDKGWVREKRIL